MDCVTVFDPRFSAYGRLLPGYDTADLEQALLTHRQPGEGMVLVSRIADPRLLLTAKALKTQLLGDDPASVILYSGRNTRPRRLLRARNGAFLIGACDFLLLLTSRDELSRRRIGLDQMTAFYVPGRVLIELYDTTLHCVPCHTHDRDGMNVLMLFPYGKLHRKAIQGKTNLVQRIPPKLSFGSRSAADGSAPQPRRQKNPPKKSTEFQLVRPLVPEEDEEDDTVSEKLKQQLDYLREVNVRTLYSKLRWRAHVAGRLRNPPEDF
jgi:hypothetical protein